MRLEMLKSLGVPLVTGVGFFPLFLELRYRQFFFVSLGEGEGSEGSLPRCCVYSFTFILEITNILFHTNVLLGCNLCHVKCHLMLLIRTPYIKVKFSTKSGQSDPNVSKCCIKCNFINHAV